MEYIKSTKDGLVCGKEPILLRGFGLGGWFLPEGYMWKLYSDCDRPRRMEALIDNLCGKDYGEEFWKNYYSTYIREKDIALIAEEGFNSIRLPLNARHLCKSINGQTTFISETINRVDELISWCRKYEIYVILDLHGAPGGQTGQNIDDSENDEPELFMNKEYRAQVIDIWKLLAERYKEEVVVAGYDLLNEPLPNWSNKYNHMILPLYRDLISEIRRIDREHMIILEGVHWATDFTVLEDFTKQEAKDNILIQFHKYWNNPDKETLVEFFKVSERLNVPLFMGEGGENNLDWYTTAFPMFERLNISWSFWSYKKMSCTNSPITFNVPEGWEELTDYLKGKKELDQDRAKIIFDNFLQCIDNDKVNTEVIHALKRQVPITIPCEAYETYEIVTSRREGANLRMSDPVTLLFKNGKTGEIDYRGQGGANQPDEENIVVELCEKENICLWFLPTKNEVSATVKASGKGILGITIGDQEFLHPVTGDGEYCSAFNCISEAKNEITLTCHEGILQVDTVNLI
jgi:endoglucanase